MTTTVKLQGNAPKVFKAIWFARILSIIGTARIAKYEIVRILDLECSARNIPQISNFTLDKYIVEMEKKGMIQSEYIGKPRIKYYMKVKTP